MLLAFELFLLSLVIHILSVYSYPVDSYHQHAGSSSSRISRGSSRAEEARLRKGKQIITPDSSRLDFKDEKGKGKGIIDEEKAASRLPDIVDYYTSPLKRRPEETDKEYDKRERCRRAKEKYLARVKAEALKNVPVEEQDSVWQEHLSRFRVEKNAKQKKHYWKKKSMSEGMDLTSTSSASTSERMITVSEKRKLRRMRNSIRKMLTADSSNEWAKMQAEALGLNPTTHQVVKIAQGHNIEQYLKVADEVAKARFLPYQSVERRNAAHSHWRQHEHLNVDRLNLGGTREHYHPIGQALSQQHQFDLNVGYNDDDYDSESDTHNNTALHDLYEDIFGPDHDAP
ncbi:hypothetical protein CBS101457_005284 [Exobasidium rhododendri]|nr:hypothetical protein CBS101457_005284 [Exobasidium rhododendri]